jgi:hypothetical protein
MALYFSSASLSLAAAISSLVYSIIGDKMFKINMLNNWKDRKSILHLLLFN